MIRAMIVTMLLTLSPASARTQDAVVLMPMLQQTGLYFASDRITASGLGAGVGVQFHWRDHILGQADVNILWGNGNTVSSRFSAGYQLSGNWSPALLGTFTLLWGQRTEVLSASGERPPSPAWAAGLRAAPLRFRGDAGVVSVLEFGYGMGPNRGMALELTILSACASL